MKFAASLTAAQVGQAVKSLLMLGNDLVVIESARQGKGRFKISAEARRKRGAAEAKTPVQQGAD